MSACQSSYEAALKINNVLTKIQSELKCGVCRSTFSNPVVATCAHTFCKDCLNQVFQLRRCIECPLCRKDIKKRSCTPSEQQDALVKGYLQLGRIFREDIQNQSFSIPKDIAYMESQVPAVTEPTNIPIRDFRPEPQFALPKARARRKQPLSNHASSKVSRMDPISEESECKENTPLQKTTKAQDNEANILARRTGDDLVRYARSKSVEVQCDLPDPACVCRDLHTSLRSFMGRSIDTSYPSDLHALFAMMPECRKLLEENISTLYQLLPPPPCAHDDVGDCRLPLKAEMVDFELKDVKEGREGLPDDVHCDELMETQPSPLIAEGMPPSVKKDDEKDDEASPSHSRPLSDVVPQSPQGSNDDMEITLHANFESFPEELTPTRCEAKTTRNANKESCSMVISISRPSCIEDENLVCEFLSLFRTVGFNQEITSTTTHLVMMNCRERTCQRRSLRYVYAIAYKCELLNRRWLEECVQSKSLLPTTQYTLTCESSSDTPAWLLSKSSKTPLFDKMKFYLPKSFSDSQLLPRQKLIELITICGGGCYDKPWELDGAQRAYTIFMPRSCESDAARRYEASMNNVPVLVADWVLDSIAEYRLLPIDSYKVGRGGPSSG
ncbi:hypothetical protein Y032_0396g669 [Ancylostoma ceylanicum]|uniref:RING-type E3 ubiquitin transferase BRCA1 n=1 Tax=Ancylostoma ceylanicum TaxID=53326 RepID=A0A016RRA6_9BILA|nr:hypothetical protein Y032_0396g669 [Ancylostoma ceylanicum]